MKRALREWGGGETFSSFFLMYGFVRVSHCRSLASHVLVFWHTMPDDTEKPKKNESRTWSEFRYNKVNITAGQTTTAHCVCALLKKNMFETHLNAVVASSYASILNFNICRWMGKFALGVRTWALISLEFAANLQLKPSRILSIY